MYEIYLKIVSQFVCFTTLIRNRNVIIMQKMQLFRRENYLYKRLYFNEK